MLIPTENLSQKLYYTNFVFQEIRPFPLTRSRFTWEHAKKCQVFIYSTYNVILLSLLLTLAKMSHILAMCADPNNKKIGQNDWKCYFQREIFYTAPCNKHQIWFKIKRNNNK